MFRFTIFGVPVTVEPWFWAIAFFLGRGFQHLQEGTMIYVAVWMMVLFFSILVHELGHAIVGHKLGGGSTWIKLWAFGGLAYHQGARFSPKNRRLMILAGPGAGLCLFALTCVLLVLVWPSGVGLELLVKEITFWTPRIYSSEAYNVLVNEPLKFDIFRQLIWVNLWWSLVNLLPIFPLDGGQFADTYIKSRKRLYMTGMVFSGLVIIVGATFFPSMFLIMMFAFFGFQNYQAYQAAQY